MQRLNVKLLMILVIAIIVLSSSVVVVHGIQMKRYVGTIPDRAASIKQDDPRKALELLFRYHQYNPDDADHYADYAMLAADCAEQTRRPQDYAAATEALGQLVHRFSDRPEMADKVADRLIQLNFDLGVYSSARDDLLRVKENSHADAKTQLKRNILLARCQIALGKYADGLKLLNAVVGYDSETKKFDAAKATGPHELDAYTLLAMLLRQKVPDSMVDNREELADQVIDQMIAVNGDTAPEKNPAKTAARAYLLQSQYLKQYDHREQAKAAIEKAISLDPDNADILLMSAEMSALSNDMSGCEQTLNKGIKLYPKDVRFYMMWVNLADIQKNPAEAQRRMDEALKEMPNSRWLLQMAFDRQLQKRDLDGARVTFKKLVDGRVLAPAYADFMEGKLLVAQGDYQLAAQRLESAKPSLDKQNSMQADSLLMQCYMALGKPDVAAQYAHMLPGTMESEVGLVTSLAAQGKATEAIEHYEKIAPLLQKFTQPAQIAAARKLSSMVVQMYISQQMSLPTDKRDWDKVEGIAAKMQQQGLLEEPMASLERIDILTRKGEKQKAAELSQQLTAQYPKDPSVINAAALLAIQAGKTEEAQHILDSAPPEVQANPALLACRMEAVLDSGKPIDVIKQSLASIAAQAEKLTDISQEDRVRIDTSLGSAYLRLGDRQEAQQRWMKVAEMEPRDTHIRSMMFDLARQVADVAKMKELQSWFTKENADDVAQNKWMEAAILVATVREAQQSKVNTGATQIELDETDKRNLSDARNLLLEVANLRPDWVEQPKLMAEIDFYEKRYDDAIEELHQAIALGQPTVDIIKRMVTLLHAQHRDEEAGQFLDRYGAMVANDPELQQTRAEIYVAAGDFKKALDILKDRFHSDSKNPQDHLLHGQLLSHAGNNAEAETEFRKAVDLGPEVPASWLELIRQLVVNNKSRDALQVLQEAQIKLPEDQRNLVMAHGYEMLGEKSQAETYYQNALSAAPDDPALLQQVATFYLNIDRPADAEKYLNQILHPANGQAANKNAVAWAGRTLAKQLAAKKDYPSFRQALELLSTTSDPTSPASILTRIQLLFNRGDANSSRQALQLLEQLKQTQALSHQQQMMLALLHERIDNWPAAHDEMLSLVGQSGADQETYVTFIEMLLRHGAAEEAATQLEAYRSKWPNPTLNVVFLAARAQAMLGRGPQAADLLLSLLPTERPLPKDKWPLLHAIAGYYDRDGFHPGYLAQIGQTDQVEKLLREEAGNEPEQSLALVSWLASRGKVDLVLDFVDQNRSKMSPAQILQLCTVAVRQSATPPTAAQIQRVTQWFDRFRRDDPDALPIQMMYADFLDFQHRFDDVEKIYRSILARKDLRSDERGAILNNLSFLLAMQGRNQDEAVKLIDQAVELFGPQSDVLDTRGVVYLSKGDTQQALADLKDAVVTSDPKPVQFVHLAMAQTAANDELGARKSLDRAKVLNFNPEDLSPLEKSRYQAMLKQLNYSSS